MIGSEILHYKIMRKLGAGGMGVVYEALDTKLERSVALKFLTDGLTHNPQAMQRFEREAKAVSRLDHPNIGAVFALEQTDDQTFLAMAMYQGQTLAERIAQGNVPLYEGLRIALEMARGLEHAHGQGVIHRDIKPANIFLARMPNSTEIIKILDFGLARLDDASRQLTRPGATTGTLLYMAPEQLSGKADALTDTWAWAAVTYEMLAGRTPFNVDGIGALLNAILNGVPAPLEEYRTDLPKILTDVVMQSLAKNPLERPQSMNLIVQQLESLVSGERFIASTQNAVVSLLEPLHKPVAAESFVPAIQDSVFFQNPSSWDSQKTAIDATASSPMIETTDERVVINIPKKRRPWIFAAIAVPMLAIAIWLIVPKNPPLEQCEPLNNTGAMLDTAIKWSAPLIPLENCGSFGYGRGSALAQYAGASEVKRQVLALLPGTVLVADAVQYSSDSIMRSMLGVKGIATQNSSYQGSGTQFLISKNKHLTALYPSYLDSGTSGEAVTLAAREASKSFFVLNVFQVDETDTEIQRLDVTTSDEHSQNFVGALFAGKTAVFLGIGKNPSSSNFNVNVPPNITRYIIAGLPSGKSYDMVFEPDRGWNYITLKPGKSGTVNSAGVLVLGEAMPKLRR